MEVGCGSPPGASTASRRAHSPTTEENCKGFWPSQFSSYLCGIFALYNRTYAKGCGERASFPTTTCFLSFVGGFAAYDRKKRKPLEGLRPCNPPACVSPTQVQNDIQNAD